MTKLLRSLFVIAVVAVVVGAQAARANEAPVNGAFTVTFALAPGTGACAGNFAVEAHGLGQTAQGPLFLTVKKCFFPASATYAGTFALCPSDSACRPDSNDAVSGTYAGAADSNIADFPGVIFTPFHGTLTITRDNGHYGPAMGTIDFTGITGRLSTLLMGTAYYSPTNIATVEERVRFTGSGRGTNSGAWPRDRTRTRRATGRAPCPEHPPCALPGGWPHPPRSAILPQAAWASSVPAAAE